MPKTQGKQQLATEVELEGRVRSEGKASWEKKEQYLQMSRSELGH